MKFLCSNCKAKYQIGDEKVAGRTLRMVCRRCKQEIVIHGEPGSGGGGLAPHAPRSVVAPTAASPLGADFQLQVAGNLRPQAMPGVLDEWHVGINEVPVGPLRREDIARRLASGVITFDSLAWREGLDDWLPIGRIPELAALVAPPPAAMPAMGLPPPPPQIVQPAQRTDLMPVGGRAGAGPAFGVEDWPQVVEATAVSHSQVGRNPLLDVEVSEQRAPSLPSWPVMFTLAGGFAFLMAALSMFGAKWLSREQAPAPVAPVAAAPVAQAPAQPSSPIAQNSDDPNGEMVIGLDEPGLRGQAAARARTVATKQPKKELTEAQKQMLARMGGGDTAAAPNLKAPASTGATSATHASGGLTAEQLSKVVLRGREQLQRCYETALRGSGSHDTVRLDVNITVSPSGNVTSVKTGGEGLPGMNVCIERTVKMWRFPAAGDTTDTKFPVVFQPGS